MFGALPRSWRATRIASQMYSTVAIREDIDGFDQPAILVKWWTEVISYLYKKINASFVIRSRADDGAVAKRLAVATRG